MPYTTAEKARLKTLRRKRTIIQDSVAALSTKLDEWQENASSRDSFLLQQTLESTQKSFDRFEDIQDELEELTEAEMQHRAPIQQTYDAIIGRARKYLHESNNDLVSIKANNSSCPSENQPHSASSLRLPKLTIPRFSGDISNWRTFHNLFRVSIHESPKLNPVEKFQYLLTSLGGEALDLVKGLAVTEANYAVAWDLLCKRYNCERRHVFHHFNSLLDLNELKHTSQLSSFIAKIREHTQALDALNYPLPQYDSLLVTAVIRKFNPYFRRRLDDYRGSDTDYPKVSVILEFLDRECLAVDDSLPASHDRKEAKVKALVVSTSSSGHDGRSNYFQGKNRRKNHSNFSSAFEQNNASSPPEGALTTKFKRPPCVCCKSNDHPIYGCSSFKQLGIQERRALVQDAGLCFNCLKDDGHRASECQLAGRCRTCHGDHNTLLCLPRTIGLTAVTDESHTLPSVLLGTALVKVQGGDGHFHTLRAVIDSASTSSFINLASAQRIGLSYKRTNEPVSGIGGCEATNGVKGHTTCIIKPRHTDTPTLPTETTIIKKIVNLPYNDVPHDFKSHFSRLDLADPDFSYAHEIEFLIGADIFPLIYTGEKRLGPPGCPVALASIFGWVITGKVGQGGYNSSKIATLITAPSTDAILRRFWELEEIPKIQADHPDDIVAEKMFKDHHYRLPNGRYVVPILKREEAPPLGDSKSVAIHRLNGIKRRLSKTPDLEANYGKFLSEYELLDHMTPATMPQATRAAYFIPHHCVTREDSKTTKLRVVFDASQKSSSGVSLNDCLYAGKKLQNEVFDVILRYRIHQKVFSCDISKMYRQILIREEERKYQHILWHKNGELAEFELNTVTYGLTSAPFLALRTLQQLVEDEGQNFPKASQIICRDRFVDDFATGCHDTSSLLELQQQIIELLRLGGFEVQKWASNCPEILARVPAEHCITSLDLDDESSSSKILGIHWKAQSDSFYYVSKNIPHSVTKRSVLSQTAKIYDPLGLISPVVFKAKTIMQKIWIEGLEWDSPLTGELRAEWVQLYERLPLISNLQIDRCVTLENAETSSLIGFSDASKLGYSATVYLRSQTAKDVRVSLLAAKSKVAPTKTISIPRLELQGAHLLSSLMAHVKTQLAGVLNVQHVAAFTDSQVVLAWLKTLPCQLKTFEANRVTHILERVEPSCWRFVPSEMNPSDLGSRGCFADQLQNHNLWWAGPKFLLDPIEKWPTFTLTQKEPLALITQNYTFWEALISKYSSLATLQRVTAWLLRYVNNLGQKPENRVKTPLSVRELEQSLMCILKAVQRKHFEDELKTLKIGEEIPKKLKHLQPFLDSDGLLRVGGRLRNANLPYHTKHPILLPKHDPFTNLLIDSYHVRYLHAGPRLLQSMLSRQFWILAARSIIRSRLSKCVICFRVRPVNQPQLMGDLPNFRVTPSKPFIVVGTDFGGPFLVREHKRRNPKLTKAYLCLFICMATKAVHLEVVSELSTEAFIAALNRFVSRRGLCRKILSDNATNYVGAKQHLTELHQFFKSQKEKIDVHLAAKQIEWQFSPASAPTFGGAWEAGIKSAKYHMKRVIGEQTLTFEEVTTVFTKIEAILNSRPLCQISTDATENDVLTPGHFLVGGPLVAVPEYDFTDVKTNRLSRWQLLQKLTQQFWRIWSQDYLHTLIQRSKWQQRQEDLKVGAVVIIGEDNTAPTRWRKGIIESVHPGKDNVVRVVSVKTARGIIKRPVIKIYPLPNQ